MKVGKFLGTGKLYIVVVVRIMLPLVKLGHDQASCSICRARFSWCAFDFRQKQPASNLELVGVVEEPGERDVVWIRLHPTLHGDMLAQPHTQDLLSSQATRGRI